MTTPRSECVPDVLARLDLARRRIEEFEEAAGVFLALRPHEVTRHPLPVRRGPFYINLIEYRLAIHVDPPTDLRLRAGEAINALRASLDNLVWGLGQKFGTNERLSLSFAKKQKDFERFCRANMVDRLPAPIRRWLEDEQAYQQPHGFPSILHQLNDLWNGDKHRLPILVGNAVASTIGPEGKVEGIACYGAFRHGELVMETIGSIGFEPTFSLELAFKHNKRLAGPFLRDAEQHIREKVIPLFEPHFAQR